MPMWHKGIEVACRIEWTGGETRDKLVCLLYSTMMCVKINNNSQYLHCATLLMLGDLFGLMTAYPYNGNITYLFMVHNSHVTENLTSPVSTAATLRSYPCSTSTTANKSHTLHSDIPLCMCLSDEQTNHGTEWASLVYGFSFELCCRKFHWYQSFSPMIEKQF